MQFFCPEILIIYNFDLLIFNFYSLPNETVQNQCNNYNYDKWMLKVTDTNGTEKSLNVLVRNKPHGIQVRIRHIELNILIFIYNIKLGIYFYIFSTNSNHKIPQQY
jgi:hypothetical protein